MINNFFVSSSKGPTEFIPSWGATCVGARKFLIAYNINLLGTKEQAHRIALNVREQGRSKEEVREFIGETIIENRIFFYFIFLAG